MKATVYETGPCQTKKSFGWKNYALKERKFIFSLDIMSAIMSVYFIKSEENEIKVFNDTNKSDSPTQATSKVGCLELNFTGEPIRN